MDPDEFEAYLETLPPMERQQVMYDFGFQKANFVPPSYDAMYQPELTQQEYDLGQYTQAPPSMDSYGNVEPYSLDVAKDFLNWQQDIGDVTADPVMAAYAGRGGFDPSAFAPITTPVGEPLDLAGSRYVNAMASAGGGYESYLAQKIQGGMTPGAAVADMWAKINAAESPEAPEDVKALAADLKASLPPLVSTDPASGLPSVQQNIGDLSTPEGRAASTNLDAITTTANDLFYKMTADQPVGYTDPNTGLQYAGATEEPSELAAHFAELGIPTPFESYTDPEWLTNPLPEGYYEGRQQNVDLAKGRVDEAKDVLQGTRENMKQLRQGWQDTADARRAATGPVPMTGTTENPYELSEGSMQAAQTAADLDWEGLQESKEGAPLLSSFIERQGPGWLASKEIGEPSQGTQEAQGDYDAAYAEWEQKSKNRLLNEAMQRGAVANRGTADPFALTSGNDVLGTYNFGGMNQHDQGALAQILGVVAQGKGYDDVNFNPYDRSYINQYGGAVQNAADQYGGAQDYYQQQQTYTPVAEQASLFDMGRALAMENAGRTPMEDALMQRSMARQTMNPYAQYGY